MSHKFVTRVVANEDLPPELKALGLSVYLHDEALPLGIDRSARYRSPEDCIRSAAAKWKACQSSARVLEFLVAADEVKAERIGGIVNHVLIRDTDVAHLLESVESREKYQAEKDAKLVRDMESGLRSRDTVHTFSSGKRMSAKFIATNEMRAAWSRQLKRLSKESEQADRHQVVLDIDWD